MKKKVIIIIAIVCAVAITGVLSMGIFKDLINLVLHINDTTSGNSSYSQMTVDELKALDDDDFYEAIWFRVIDKLDYEDYDNETKHLNEYEKTFHILADFEYELGNGGLCQYLCNSEERYSDELCQLMKEFGCDELEKEYSAFVETLDLKKLNYDFDKAIKVYPFEDFDEKFYEVYEKKPLQEILVDYARENVEQF